jgi:hypothetical protein
MAGAIGGRASMARRSAVIRSVGAQPNAVRRRAFYCGWASAGKVAGANAIDLQVQPVVLGGLADPLHAEPFRGGHRPDVVGSGDREEFTWANAQVIKPRAASVA